MSLQGLFYTKPDGGGSLGTFDYGTPYVQISWYAVDLAVEQLLAVMAGDPVPERPGFGEPRVKSRDTS